MLSVACLAREKYRQVSHLPASFQRCCLVSKTRYREAFTRTFLLTCPFGWTTVLATGLEFLQLLQTLSHLCLPSWSGKKDSLLTCGVSEGNLPSHLPTS